MKTILVAPHLLKLDRIVSQADQLRLVVHSIQVQVRCPKCACISSHLHSRYERTLADLPWEGIAVQIKLEARRFFCDQENCRQRIFCERLPELAARYARKTMRLNKTLQWLGLLVGGEAGAKVAAQLGFGVSADTLLRRIRAANLPAVSTPKVLGVDDWAKRKGQTYGTILVDLERHQVVDLLPDREATTLANWLQQHAGVEIITRDRAAAYAEGARLGAPAAIQIADRWHILKNLTEVVERFLQTKYSALQVAAKQSRPQPVATTVVSAETKPPPSTKLARWNERRQARYEEVRQCWQQGATIKRMAEQFGMHRRTVRLFIRSENCPQRLRPRSRASQLDPHLEYLAQRWADGCHSAADLYRDLRLRGFHGSQSLVRHYVAQWRSALPPELKRARRGPETTKPAVTERKKLLVPSPRNTAWWLLQKQEKLEAEQQVYVQRLCETSPEIVTVQQLAQRFARLVRERRAQEFAPWLAEAATSSSQEIKGFVAGLKRDQQAVEAALRYAWSNGQTEGQVNKLKNLKRSMFGRAKFDLLKARVLAAP
ncbi:MAG: ISL3 family transposase [Acidobacteria bacterium]|nr:ISL3 family transposase [Acidobacteriota bacterium]